MKRVMIALDGTDLDPVLAGTAHDLFGDDAEYWAVNVQRLEAAPRETGARAMPVPFGGSYPFVHPQLYDIHLPEQTPADIAEQRATATAMSAVEDSDLPGATVVGEVGHPPDAILRAADQQQADVVVVGTHDRSWWSELLHASVADTVLSEARTPVLLVTDRR